MNKTRSRILFALTLVFVALIFFYVTYTAEGQGHRTAGQILPEGWLVSNDNNAIDLEYILTTTTTGELSAAPDSWYDGDTPVVVYYPMGTVWALDYPDGDSRMVIVAPFVCDDAWCWTAIVTQAGTQGRGGRAWHCDGAVILAGQPRFIQGDFSAGYEWLMRMPQQPIVISVTG